MSDKKIIIELDSEDNKPIPFNGWISKTGQVYRNEEDARRANCTHLKCDCGNIREKHYGFCPNCCEKLDNEKYLKLEAVEWDGETPLSLFNCELYFYNEDDIRYYCEEHDVNCKDLQLVLCEKEVLPILDAYDFLNDYFGEDVDGDDLDDEIYKAAKFFNDTVRELFPVCWVESKKRIIPFNFT